jgi:hypothetical protein
MVYQTRNILTESQKNDIRSMYGINPQKRDYIFELCTTVDGRYFILRDDVFDIQEQKSLGNLWGSIDVFKNIFQNVKIENEPQEYTQIKESILSLPILEGKENLYELRDILIEWSFWENTWLGNKLSDAGKAIKDSVTAGWEGLKQFGVAISKGEWSQILSLLASGVKWVLRKLKEAMYSTIGMIVDAILIATGVGKTVQWIPWALVTALDVYQLATDDWPEEEKNDPFWLKCLTLGFDILGLVTAGAMAKSAKAAATPLKALSKSPGRVAQYLEKNPKLKGLIQSMIDGINKVPSFLSKAQATIASKWGAGGKYIADAIGWIRSITSKFVSSLSELIGKLSSKEAGKATATNTGMLYGFDKGAEKYIEYKTGMSMVQIKNLEKFDNLAKKYGNKDPFE